MNTALRYLIAIAAALLILSPARATAQISPAVEAEHVLRTARINGGLLVHLGCGDGALTAALDESSRFLIQGLDRDPAAIAAARQAILENGNYGRVSVRLLQGDHLPYVDGSVNLLVVDKPLGILDDELRRVLAPLGRIVKRTDDHWTTEDKPWPEEIDEWTHFLHGPDNNAVARDSVVGPPRHLQWIADPIHLRSHEHLNSLSALVTARGRIFYVIDEGPVAAVAAPPQWRLVARDAFNGKLLWKRDLGPWEGHFRLFRSGPTDIARRLVVSDHAVYVTLGYNKKVAAMDPATGETRQVFDATNGAIEILHEEGRLYVLCGTIDEQEYAKTAAIYYPSPPPRNKRIVALNANTGQVFWQRNEEDTSEILPATMAAAEGKLYFQNTKEVVALNAEDGEPAWRAERPVYTTRLANSTPTLVVSGGVVLSADGSTGGVPDDVRRGEDTVRWIMSDQDVRKHPDGDVVAFNAATGKKLWAGTSLQGFCSPGDVFVVDRRAWIGAKVGSANQTLDVSLDLFSGEELSRTTDRAPTAGHTRCYRNKATERFLVLGGVGVEFVDLDDWSWSSNLWVRGTCQYGVMPANGLLYVPPDSCACRPNARLHGFTAMAPAREQAVPPTERLLTGPAAGETIAGKNHATDWATYRKDNARTGRTEATVSVDAIATWQHELGGRLTAPTVAGGQVFVAQVDTHTVHALDLASGEIAWSFTADGPVDSPPTIDSGLVVFGCRDGCVYCLRAADGQLAWRYRAAPVERFLVAQEQIESIWPLHGSLLVRDGLVWYAAGRSAYLDGGHYLGAVQLATGKPVVDKTLDGRNAAQWITGATGPDKPIRNTLPGTKLDIMSASGDLVFLGWATFDTHGNQVPDVQPHLFSATGFLDDTWWHRTYWQYGAWMRGGFGGWPQAARQLPAARLMVVDSDRLLGFGREKYDMGNPNAVHAGHIGVIKDTYQDPGRVDFAHNRYQLYSAPKPVAAQVARRKPAAVPYHWKVDIPLLVRAMVLAGDTLWIAGPDAKQANQGLIELPTVQPGRLWAVSPDDGTRQTEQPLAAAPVLDGMAVVPGHIVLSCTDGIVRCITE